MAMSPPGGASGAVALLVLLPGTAGAGVVAPHLGGLVHDGLHSALGGHASGGARGGGEDRLLLLAPPLLLAAQALLLHPALLLGHGLEQEQEADGVVLDPLLHLGEHLE